MVLRPWSPSLCTTGLMTLACWERWKRSTRRPSNTTKHTNFNAPSRPLRVDQAVTAHTTRAPAPYKYPDFHKYIRKKLITFYERFSPADVKDAQAEPCSPKEGDVVEVGTLPNCSIVQPAYDMSCGSDEDAKGLLLLLLLAPRLAPALWALPPPPPWLKSLQPPLEHWQFRFLQLLLRGEACDWCDVHCNKYTTM